MTAQSTPPLSPSDSSPSGTRGCTAPADAFVAACSRAGVAPAEVDALWRLHVGDGRVRGWTLQELLASHAEWATFRRSRLGEDDAARAFELRWRAYVAAFFRGRATRDEVDELTARFFERAYRVIDTSFTWQCPFTVYLRAILVNLARDQWRSNARRRSHERSIEDEPRAWRRARQAPGRSPEAAVLAGERDDAVRAALASLSESDRAVLVTVLVEGRTRDDAAAALGISRDAVYQRLCRAKERLRVALGRRGSAHGEDEDVGRGRGDGRAAVVTGGAP